MRSAAPLLAALALTGVATAPAVSATRPATAPIVGRWMWSDNDEALANPRNAHVFEVRARGRGLIARFGHGAWVGMTWKAGTRSFKVTAPRRAGQHGEQRVKVTYAGRVTLKKGTWTATGRLRIRAAGFPGRSSFTATRLP